MAQTAASSPTRRPRPGLLAAAAVAAVAVLAGAPRLAGGSPPPGTLPTTARVPSWSCPPPQSWHPSGGSTYTPPTTIRLPAAAVSDGDWDAMGGAAWWRLPAPAVGHDVLQFRPTDHSTAPLKPGAPIHYRFTPAASGRYRWVMQAAAPHPTDHNDVWVRWGGSHGSGWGRQKRATGAGWSGLPSMRWTKVYTSYGKGRWAWGGYTKDHDAHMLITTHLTAGKTYEFQMTGRSCQIRVAAFGLVRCDVDGNGSPGCAHLGGLDATPMAVCK